MIKNLDTPENKPNETAIHSYFVTGSIELIYQHYKRGWYYFALSITKDKSLAEDCVADFCEKLLCFDDEKRSLLFLDANGYEEAVLFCILRNLCLDQIRKQQRRKSIVQQLFFTSPSINTDTTHKNDLLVITNKLAPRQREILLLHINGYTNQEIAEQLSISYHSVKNTLSDAKSKFKLWYEKL